MSTDRLLERVRAANPAPARAIADDALFARIVAGPGDPRLAAPAAARPRRRRRMGTRGLALLIGAVVLCGAGGTVGAVQLLSHDSPKALFKADPAGQYSRFPGHTGGTGQTVIPQSVRRAATFTVPGVGRFAYWIALSRPHGWLCSAIRQPDGTWADLGDDKYQLGGPVPGCGNLPWHDAHGFSYYNTSIQHKQTTWRIVYGYLPTTGHPVTVRDRVSGTTAPIGDGRYFAIVLPLCKGHTCSLPVPRPDSGFRLETLDAAGRVLVTDAYDPGM